MTEVMVKEEKTRPSDGEIVSALALSFRVHESKILEWLFDMDLKSCSNALIDNF